ncbi:MAG: thioesterase II family protein [Nitrospiraceae bacterium]
MLTIPRSTKWVVTHRQVNSGLRLICFPYAGGSASMFRSWSQDAMLADVEVCAVQFPGREARIAESPVDDLRRLVPLLREELEPYLDRPFALFGHSIGALVSFELARELRRTCGIQPCHLFVSGCPAPHLPHSERMWDLPDEEFLERLCRFNGTPPEVLNHPELMDMMLPTIRADFALRDRYVYREEPPLNCSITAFGGMSDQHVSGADLRAWRQHTRERFQLWLFQGDHFFLRSAQETLLETVFSRLATEGII